MDFSNQLTTPVSAIDTGLLCLAAICRFHQLPVEPAQLAREYGASFDAVTLQRAAKALGLRCKPTGVLRAAPNSPPPPQAGCAHAQQHRTARHHAEKRRQLLHFGAHRKQPVFDSRFARATATTVERGGLRAAIQGSSVAVHAAS